MSTWPEGVIARYLTKAAEISGNVTVTTDVSTIDGELGAIAECHGCGSDWKNFYEPSVRAWAQRHAETCRAMSRPTEERR